ncbi:unnamed protein product [Aureobasidium pullulans]|nr:unnamed protein product [Aureobasidium pullulans]
MSHSDSMRYWSRGPFIHVDELRNYFAPEDTSGWKTWAIVKVSEDQAIGFVATSTKRKGVSEIGYLVAPLGFKLEGHLRAEWETHIGVRDSLIFGLLAEEWQSGVAD